jgi:drug/metabolite transporter (DMT)-like permease
VSTVLNSDTDASPWRSGHLQRYTGIGLLVPACISWGLSTVLTKIVLEQLTPVDLFGIEVVVSAVPLALLALIRGTRPGRPSPVLLLLGVLEPGLTYLLFDFGVGRTAASHAALLLALDAPVTLLLAVGFLRERVDLLLVASLALGVGGTVLVTWRNEGPDASLIGDILVIASALTGAAFGVLARHATPNRDVVVVTAVQMLGALSIAVPVFVVSFARGDSSIATADGAHLVLGVAVGLLGGVIPFLLFNRAIARVPASQAGLVLVLIPVVGAGASVLLLAERLSVLAVSGGVLALAGAALAALRADDGPATTVGPGTPASEPPAGDPLPPAAPPSVPAQVARESGDLCGTHR